MKKKPRRRLLRKVDSMRLMKKIFQPKTIWKSLRMSFDLVANQSTSVVTQANGTLIRVMKALALYRLECNHLILFKPFHKLTRS